MPGLLDWIGGIFGSPQYGPPAPPSGGMLTNPQGIREQALYGALGQLGAGLLAAGARRPVTQPSPLPQALAGFGPAYRQGIQTGQQEAAIERQADQERRWNDVATGTTAIPGIPAEMLPTLRILGPQLGPQIVAQRLGRGTATPMSDAESIQIFGTTGGFRDQNGMPTLPQGPRTQGLTTQEQERARAPFHPIIEPPGGRILENPGLSYGGGAPRPPAGMPQPGGPTPNPGALVRPGGPAGDPRSGERPWMAEDFLGLPGMTREDAQARADSMNRDIQPRVAAPAPGVPGPVGPRPAAVTGPQGMGPRVLSQSPVPPSGTVENRRNADLGALQVETIKNWQTAAARAGEMRTSLGQMENILREGGTAFGPGSTFQAQLGAVAERLGVSPENVRQFIGTSPANAETFQAISRRLVYDMIGSLGTGVSNADRSFIESVVPQLGTNPGAAQNLIDYLRARADGSVQRFQEGYQNFQGGGDPLAFEIAWSRRAMPMPGGTALPGPQPRGGQTGAAPPVPAPPLPPTASANGAPVAVQPGRPGALAPAGAVPLSPPAPNASAPPQPTQASRYTPQQQQQLIGSARGLVNAAPPERREAERARLQEVLRRGGVEWDGR